MTDEIRTINEGTVQLACDRMPAMLDAIAAMQTLCDSDAATERDHALLATLRRTAIGLLRSMDGAIADLRGLPPRAPMNPESLWIVFSANGETRGSYASIADAEYMLSHLMERYPEGGPYRIRLFSERRMPAMLRLVA